jgi:hypothetical protein
MFYFNDEKAGVAHSADVSIVEGEPQPNGAAPATATMVCWF